MSLLSDFKTRMNKFIPTLQLPNDTGNIKSERYEKIMIERSIAMLLQVGIANYKSIDERIVLSLVATQEESHPDFIRVEDGIFILPTALIVGPNGAGKSNLFQALQHLQDIFLNGENLPYFPHHLETHKNTSIDLQVVIEGKRLAYGITFNAERIIEEYLAEFNGEVPIAIFERDEENLRVGEQAIHLPKRQSAIVFLGNDDYPMVKRFYQFYTDSVIVALVDEKIERQEVVHLLQQKPLFHRVRSLLRRLDIGIEDLVIKNEVVSVKYRSLTIPLKHESTGMKRLIYLLTIICDALAQGKVILIDELERNLHTILTTTIIKLFNSPVTNAENAQLICSSHNTHLLDLNLFRQDQIWFMEKDMERLQTDLYSLYNIQGVLEDENIEYGYVEGKYGATFKINFAEVIKDE